MKTLMDREDWQEMKAAMQGVAKRFGVTVHCSQKYEYMNVNFEKRGLAPHDVVTLETLEKLIMLVSDQGP